MKNVLKKSDTILKGLVNIQMVISIAMLVIVIVLNAVEIFQRNVFANSFIWIQEISTVGMLWFSLLSMGVIIYEKQDMIVSFFLDRFPVKLNKIAHLVIHAVVSVFCVVVLQETIRLFQQQAGSTTMVAHIPLQIRSIPVIICFVTILLENVLMFFNVLVLNEGVRKEEGGTDK